MRWYVMLCTVRQLATLHNSTCWCNQACKINLILKPREFKTTRSSSAACLARQTSLFPLIPLIPLLYKWWEYGAFWRRCLGNGCGMWISPGCIGVELKQFFCLGLLKRVGVSVAFGFPWEGELLWCFQGCANLAFNSGEKTVASTAPCSSFTSS